MLLLCLRAIKTQDTHPIEHKILDLCEGYKEEQDLVVLQGTTQTHKGNKEQEDSHADDACHHLDTGDQAKPFPPGCHTNQQQAHQLRGEKCDNTRKKKEKSHFFKSGPGTVFEGRNQLSRC